MTTRMDRPTATVAFNPRDPETSAHSADTTGAENRTNPHWHTELIGKPTVTVDELT